MPQVRDECVALLTTLLSQYEQFSDDLNGFLIFGLVKLKATEAIDLIEQVFTSGKASDEMNGSWAAIQVKLGLANADDFERGALLCASDRQRMLENELVIMLPKKQIGG